jgi:transposase InsO family protein
MRFPQLVVLALDDWLGRQVAELARRRRWLLREARQFGAAMRMLTPPRPTVLLAQLDPRREQADGLQFLADVHIQCPDTATVAVSDVKINHDAERSLWTATVLDLGARAVLYPPLTKPVLEEIVDRMMTAVIDRTRPGWEPPGEAVIDLAEEVLAQR